LNSSCTVLGFTTGTTLATFKENPLDGYLFEFLPKTSTLQPESSNAKPSKKLEIRHMRSKFQKLQVQHRRTKTNCAAEN
jgi:hypothetical protein